MIPEHGSAYFLPDIDDPVDKKNPGAFLKILMNHLIYALI